MATTSDAAFAGPELAEAILRRLDQHMPHLAAVNGAASVHAAIAAMEFMAERGTVEVLRS